MRLAVRLTGRTLRSNPSSAAVLALGVAVLTFIALASLAVPQVVDRQNERTYRATPVVRYDAGAQREDLLTVDPLATPDSRWNGNRIVRRYYAAATDDIQIPGVGSAPGPGEYYASPALAELIKRDGVIRSLFADLERRGSINPDGLTEPHELTAIIGVARDERLPLLPVVGFGSKQQLGPTDDLTTLNATVASIAASLVWLPGVAFLLIITRLLGRHDRQRVRSLRAIGVSIRAVRAIQAGQAGFIALFGIAGGAIAYNLALTMTRVPGTDFGFFRGDAALPPAHQLAVCGLVLAAVLATTGTAQTVEWYASRKERRRFSRLQLPTVGVGMLGTGFAYLSALPITAPALGGFAILGMWLSCALAAGGLAMAGPRLVGATGSWLARRSRTAGTLVGLRLVSTSTTTTTRLASLACVVIVLLLGSLSFASILKGGTSAEWSAELAKRERIPTVAIDFTGSVSRQAIERVYSGPVAQLASAAAQEGSTPVVIASCQGLQELVGAPLASCDSAKLQWLNEAGTVHPTLAAGATSRRSEVPVMRSASLPGEFTGAMLVSPVLASGLQISGGSQFYVLPRGSELAESMAAMSSTGPGIQFTLGELGRKNPDLHRYPSQVEWIFVGAMLSLVLAVLAILATALGEASDRQACLAPLRRIGAPRRDFQRVHFACTFLPLLTLGWTAAAVGWFVCRGMRAVDDRATVPESATVAAVAVVAAVSVTLAAATLPEARRGVSALR